MCIALSFPEPVIQGFALFTLVVTIVLLVGQLTRG